MKFKEGNKGKPKGAISEKTRFWNELKDFITEEGADKYKQELMALDGKDFITAYNNILEYFKPKLARTEVDHTTQGEKIVPVINVLPPNE